MDFGFYAVEVLRYSLLSKQLHYVFEVSFNLLIRVVGIRNTVIRGNLDSVILLRIFASTQDVLLCSFCFFIHCM